MKIKTHLHRLWRFLKRENLHRLLAIIGLMIVFSSLSITFFEPNVDLINGLWWSIVTLTTVGYGDISPVTPGGRVVAIIMMFFGIGLLGLFSATIASVLVDYKIKEDRGMNTYNFTDHIILCEWNPRAQVILEQFRADPHTAESPVVLIANVEHKPVSDENLFFVRGDVNDATLRQANLAQAKTVVVLGDDNLDPATRDAKVVLHTLTVESINPNAYTIVELSDIANLKHCERANADEIIVASELNSNLIARTALNHGLSKVISEMLRTDTGNELYKIPVPPSLAGKTFIDALIDVKKKHQSILLAIQKGAEGQVVANPADNLRLEAGDYFILVAQEKPTLA